MTDTRRQDWAERQRALGRRRWDAWVTDPERATLKQRLAELRKATTPHSRRET